VAIHGRLSRFLKYKDPLREEDIDCVVNKFGTELKIQDYQYLEPEIINKFGTELKNLLDNPKNIL
jgi:hypothetical protein